MDDTLTTFIIIIIILLIAIATFYKDNFKREKTKIQWREPISDIRYF